MGKKGKFLSGALLGIGLGFLFAPKKGSETRKDLKKGIDDLIAKTKELDVNELREDIEVKIAEIKLQIEELDKETVLKAAKKKAKQIQDLSKELVDYATEKGTPVIEKMASNVKKSSIKLTKEILSKMEDSKKAE